MLGSCIDLGNPVSAHPLNANLLAWYSPLPQSPWLVNLCRQTPSTYSGVPAYTLGQADLPALSFGGSNHWTAPGAETGVGAGNFTVSFAIRSGYPTAGLVSSSRGSSSGVVGWLVWVSGSSVYLTLDTGGAYDQPNVSALYGDDVWHRLCWSIVRGSTATLYMDGVIQGAAQAISSSGTLTGSGSSYIGAFGGGSYVFTGTLADVRVHTRALPADGVWSEYDQWRRGHPDTLRRWSRRAYLFGSTTGGTAYTLTASAGSVVMTGQAATLRAARTLAADAGAITLTGASAGLLAARSLTAGAGSITLTGASAGLLAARSLTAGAGSITLTGASAGLLAARSLTAGAGSLTISGQVAGLVVGRRLGAGTGTYTLAGSAAGVRAGRALTGGSGAYALTGGAAGLRAARTMGAGAGSLALTGHAAGLAVGRAIAAGVGTYTLTGQSAGFARGFALAAAPGAYTLAGGAVTLTVAAPPGVAVGVLALARLAAGTLTLSPLAAGTLGGS